MDKSDGLEAMLEQVITETYHIFQTMRSIEL
jgi:hypothetical protein